MKKRLQNKIAGSRTSLPVALIYGTVVWLLAGLIQERLWIQYGCFILSVLLIMKMNNKNLLIRIFSRSVSVTFIFLFCLAVFLFHSWRGGVAQVCCITSLLLLFDCYQDNTAIGQTYYIFLIMGIGSLFDIQVFLYVPVFWLMMKVIVYSIGWRTFLASLLGLITPYGVSCSYGFEFITPLQWLFIIYLFFLFVITSIHFTQKSYLDKIRVRQLYYGFIMLAIYSLLLILLIPDNEGLAIRMLIIATSPLFGHFMALTNTRLSNLTFCILSVITVVFTCICLWTILYPS